ncbi:DUF6916 family protein [Halomonas denitrificans]|nr:hypothetical protein [Halomonas denitrificans]
MTAPDDPLPDYETFARHAGDRVRLVAGDVHRDGRIAEVDALNRQPGQERQPFSLVVVAEGDALPQQTLTLEHEALGELQLFLVPVGPRDGGVAYEAVFT